MIASSRNPRQQLAFYFDDVDTPVGRIINILITGLILLSCGLFVAETYPLPHPLRLWLHWVDDGILVLFTIEYCLRFWSAPRRRTYFFKLASLIDLFVLLPFIFGASNLSFLRIFRWLRILRLIRFIGGRTIFGYLTTEDTAIVLRILFTIFAIIFVYAGLIYQVEHPINGDQFHTFLDAVYFAVSSISTAGFGDITPISQLGRLLAVLMILTGLVLIPWQLGDLIKRLIKTSELRVIACPQCGLAVHDADAQYCKSCGTALPIPTPIPTNMPAAPDSGPVPPTNL
jgi:voltage-gated potassium channel